MKARAKSNIRDFIDNEQLLIDEAGRKDSD